MVGMDDQTADRRLNMRISSTQEHLLKAAAGLQGQTVTGFVLSAATDRARAVVGEAERIELTKREFDRFIDALDSPVESMPVLRRYARR